MAALTSFSPRRDKASSRTQSWGRSLRKWRKRCRNLDDNTPIVRRTYTACCSFVSACRPSQPCASIRTTRDRGVIVCPMHDTVERPTDEHDEEARDQLSGRLGRRDGAGGAELRLVRFGNGGKGGVRHTYTSMEAPRGHQRPSHNPKSNKLCSLASLGRFGPRNSITIDPTRRVKENSANKVCPPNQ